MGKLEMRVQIAKDVLRLLRPARKDRVEARPRLNTGGPYFEMNEVDKEVTAESELRDVIKGKECSVCALGALFVAEVWRNDAFKLKDAGFLDRDISGYTAAESLQNAGIDRPDITPRLEKYFSLEEMQYIESWFEACHVKEEYDPDFNDEIIDAAQEFGHKHGDEKVREKRLRVLLNFLIREEGRLNWRKFLKEVS